MNFFRNSILVILIILVGIFSVVDDASAQEPVIRAILLYSPTCPHCLDVINEILPPLVEQYGTSQLQIYGVNTYTDIGDKLFKNTAETFNTSEERQVVPTLVIGDQVLVGSIEIAELLPDLIELGLLNGGIDWPPIPGLIEAMTAIDPGTENNTSAITQEFTLKDKFT